MTDMQIAQHYACLTGDIRFMRRTSRAMNAVLGVLRDENTDIFHVDGLLEALDILTHGLDERADFLAHDIIGEPEE